MLNIYGSCFPCHVEEVIKKVRRKSRKLASRRLVPSDFFTARPAFHFYKWNIGRVRNTNEKNPTKYLRLQDLIIEIFSMTRGPHGACCYPFKIKLIIMALVMLRNTPFFDNLHVLLLLRCLKGFKTR